MGYVHVFKTKINSELNEDLEKRRPRKTNTYKTNLTIEEIYACVMHVSYIMYHTVHAWLDAGVNLLCTPRVARKRATRRKMFSNVLDSNI